MKIILIGFMGSGKTSAALILSDVLHLEAIEIDHLILMASGRNSISEIFVKDGEKKFRELETKMLKEISKQNNLIISTGGGVVMKERNKRYLKMGVIIFLKTSFEVLEQRLDGDITRPLFKDRMNAKKLFNVRQSKYEQWAHHVIETDKNTVEQVVNNIISIL